MISTKETEFLQIKLFLLIISILFHFRRRKEEEAEKKERKRFDEITFVNTFKFNLSVRLIILINLMTVHNYYYN